MESYNCFNSSGQHKYYTFLKELSCSDCEETDTVNIINMKSCEMLKFGINEKYFFPPQSQHLKGRLGPPVGHVPFFNQMRSAGAPQSHVFNQRRSLRKVELE